MTHPVAIIPYTNMAPLQVFGPPQGCRFVPMVPRESITALLEKRVIAAAVPVGGLPALDSAVDLLGPFGIAARERSMSVLLFSKRPFADIPPDARFRLTSESASSVRLLYLLHGYRNGFKKKPTSAGNGRSADGELLIGDAALLMRKSHRENRSHEYPFVTDLAEEWFAMHSLPFVFARWVIRKDAPGTARRALENWLDEFRVNEFDLIHRAAPPAARSLGLPLQEVLDYFRTVRRVLDQDDLAGQERFLTDLELLKESQKAQAGLFAQRKAKSVIFAFLTDH
ncbi:MAG: hypothetical protein P1S46_00560 [bacterium]|nr:hypothetical protein [bacterium]MDT8396275.1 MqnA/MqnD/SBP family protein [bacterium]